MATIQQATKVIARPEMGKDIYDAYALNKYDEYEKIGYVCSDTEKKALKLASKKAEDLGKAIDFSMCSRKYKNTDRVVYSRFNP